MTMDGVEARRIFDMLVGQGYSPRMSAHQAEDVTDFTVALDIDSMDTVLGEVVRVALENDLEVALDRKAELCFYAESDGFEEEDEPDPAVGVTNDA